MWKVEFDKKSKKQLSKLDSTLDFLNNPKIKNNPKSSGKGLTSKFKGLWRYRVGDYRIICDLKSEEIIILVIKIDHRKQIYKDF